jgi:2,3-bisphosphoglycerate-independent phosphoglycerate mutase
LDTLGIDFEFAKGDLAARGNFCSLDNSGVITDRRAGRIASDKAARLCNDVLKGIEIDGIKTFVMPVKEHRFSVIFRGAGLGDKLNDSDPQQEGMKAHEVKALDAGSAFSARIVNAFIAEANKRLKNETPANGILLRGFSKMIDMPSFDEIYQLNAAAIALYPMYRGLACLVGMKVLATGTTLQSEFDTLKAQFANFDFFYIHIKYTDSAGEDGDFERKVKVIEEVDGYLSALFELKPDVVIVTGDHSTPATMKSHSWHPVPLLINSKVCRSDKATQFNETQCLAGGLGHISAQSIMPLALANAGRLIKYGA